MDAWGSDLDDTFRYVFSQEACWGCLPKFINYTVQRPRLQYSLPVQFFNYIPRRGLVCSGRARHKSWKHNDMNAGSHVLLKSCVERASHGSAGNGISFSGGYWKRPSTLFGHWEGSFVRTRAISTGTGVQQAIGRVLKARRPRR